MKQKKYNGKEFDWRFELTKEQKAYIQLFKNEFDNGASCDQQNLRHLAALITASFIDSEFAERRAAGEAHCVTGSTGIGEAHLLDILAFHTELLDLA